MRTDLEEDEHLVDICDSNSGIVTSFHVRIGKDKKIYHYQQRTRRIDCSTIGKIFITNKRIIFESSKEEENSQDHFFYHKDIEITHGRNGRYLPPIPGAFLIYPFEEIDWTEEFRSTQHSSYPEDNFGKFSVYYRETPYRNVSLIVNNVMGYENFNKIGYEYFNTSYGGDLSNKLNNEFYSPHEERVNSYLKKNNKLYLLDKEETKLKNKIAKAKHHEKLLEFEDAELIYQKLEMEDEVIRVRKLKAEQGSVKVTQKVVHGDEVTEIKDSVISKSNVGAGGKSKSEELREAKALLDDGIIDDDEFKQMKKEILGK